MSEADELAIQKIIRICEEMAQGRNLPHLGKTEIASLRSQYFATKDSRHLAPSKGASG